MGSDARPGWGGGGNISRTYVFRLICFHGQVYFRRGSLKLHDREIFQNSWHRFLIYWWVKTKLAVITSAKLHHDLIDKIHAGLAILTIETDIYVFTLDWCLTWNSADKLWNIIHNSHTIKAACQMVSILPKPQWLKYFLFSGKPNRVARDSQSRDLLLWRRVGVCGKPFWVQGMVYG